MGLVGIFIARSLRPIATSQDDRRAKFLGEFCPDLYDANKTSGPVFPDKAPCCTVEARNPTFEGVNSIPMATKKTRKPCKSCSSSRSDNEGTVVIPRVSAMFFLPRVLSHSFRFHRFFGSIFPNSQHFSRMPRPQGFSSYCNGDKPAIIPTCRFSCLVSLFSICENSAFSIMLLWWWWCCK